MKNYALKIIAIVIVVGFAATSFAVMSNYGVHNPYVRRRVDNIVKPMASNNVISPIQVGSALDAVAFDPLNGYMYVANACFGSVSVTGLSYVKYPVKFTESGLPSGSTWYVNITGHNCCDDFRSIDSGPITGSTYLFMLSVESYTYTIATSDKTYEPSPSSGSFSFSFPHGESMTIKFSKMTYPVTFIDSGLPSGTDWYANITESNGTVYDSGAISGSSYFFSLTNGSYTYSVSTSDHTYTPSLSSGSFKVNGSSPATTAVAFKEVTYLATFTESGLSSGTSWSVTFNGTTLSSTTNTIAFSVTNGTYSYTIGKISGYNISTSSGSLTISGKNITQSITFSSVPSTTPPPKKPSTPSSSNTDLYIIIGAVAAVAVVGAVATIMIRKKK
jgi:hypothetical protein